MFVNGEINSMACNNLLELVIALVISNYSIFIFMQYTLIELFKLDFQLYFNRMLFLSLFDYEYEEQKGDLYK